MDLLTLSLSSLFGGGTAANGEGATGANPMSLIIMVGMFALMYFFMIRPQKKKQKEEEKMRNNIQPGDEIMTIGGFYGKVISVKEDSIVIESVVDRSKQKILRTAVQQNLTVHDDTDDK